MIKVTQISDGESTNFRCVITGVKGEIRFSSVMKEFDIVETDEIYLTQDAETVRTLLKEEPIVSLDPRESSQVETSQQKHTMGSLRGENLYKDASDTINGERQAQYGDPEDTFKLIGQYWADYFRLEFGVDIEIKDYHVAFMNKLEKTVREMFSHKRDNIVDDVGYSGIYDDMRG